jgi:hypothetical protein
MHRLLLALVCLSQSSVSNAASPNSETGTTTQDSGGTFVRMCSPVELISGGMTLREVHRLLRNQNWIGGGGCLNWMEWYFESGFTIYYHTQMIRDEQHDIVTAIRAVPSKKVR